MIIADSIAMTTGIATMTAGAGNMLGPISKRRRHGTPEPSRPPLTGRPFFFAEESAAVAQEAFYGFLLVARHAQFFSALQKYDVTALKTRDESRERGAR
jgi:hypothetical protein